MLLALVLLCDGTTAIYAGQTVIVSKNSFDIDSSIWDVVWYPKDKYDVKHGTTTVGYVYIVCGSAVMKNDKSQQVLLVRTEMVPLSNIQYGSVWWHAVNDHIKITAEYNGNMIEDDYAPQTQTVTVTSGGTFSLGIGGNANSQGVGGNASLGVSSNATVPANGTVIYANSKYTSRITERTIEYAYNPKMGIVFSTAWRSKNQALNHDLVQTFQFKYDYNGSGKAPTVYIRLDALMRLAVTDIPCTWPGNTTSFMIGGGNSTLNVRFGIVGY